MLLKEHPRERTKGFTLVETLMVFFLVTTLIALVFRLSSHVQVNYLKGTVDLQNLQEARSAINSLRRDFLGATPRFERSDGVDLREATRKKPIVSSLGGRTPGKKTVPIIVGTSELHLFKYSFGFGEDEPAPRVEEVSYFVDKGQKALIREDEKGKKLFRSVTNAKFILYQFPLNPDIHLVAVNLEIDNSASGPGKSLEICTTISSLIVSQNLNNLNWNWDPQN